MSKLYQNFHLILILSITSLFLFSCPFANNSSTGTSDTVPVITPTPTIDLSANLLTNGDFSDDFNNWGLYVMSTNPQVEIVNEELIITNLTNESNSWDPQIRYLNLNIENNNQYYVQFDAKSYSERSIKSTVGLNQSPYTLYSDDNQFNLTTEMKTFSYYFIMKQPTDNQARLVFDIGNNDQNVIIDNVYLIKLNEINYITPTISGTQIDDQIDYPADNTDTWTPGAGWTLQWSDEFTDNTINSSNWSHRILDPGTYNNELQSYTDSSENSYIDNGYLVIKAIRDDSGTGDPEYSSARLITNDKQVFKYGKIAARIQLPYGLGSWPAFWMLGDNVEETGGAIPWPASGEIDIFEQWGNNGGGDRQISGTLHYDNGGHVYETPGVYSLETEKMALKFHVFEIEWDSNEIIWKVDGIEFNRVDITPVFMEEFHENFYIILNIAISSEPDAFSYYPKYMYIDWVRVYSQD